MPRINIESKEDQDKLKAQYKQTYQDIQEYLINADELYNVISTVDQNINDIERSNQEKLNGQQLMYLKKLK